MRVYLVICLVALLSVAPTAEAQENLLPPCSDGQLATLAQIQPAFETLIEEAPSTTDRDGFKPYIVAYFSWREGLWSRLPLCAEMLEIGVLMNRIASNRAAIPALELLLGDYDIYDNADPYAAGDASHADDRDLLARHISAVGASLNDETRISPEESSLGACSDSDIESFYAVVYDQYVSLAESFYRFRAYVHLLNAIETLAQWRAQVWRSLPACAGMAEMTWLMTQAAGDLAAFLSLKHADMETEADLYEAEIARSSTAIAEKAPAFLGSDTADVVLPESQLPGCARSQINEFTAVILEYAQLTNSIDDIESMEDVFAFGQRQYEWREERLEDLPRCAEAFELGLMIDQSTGDFVVALALLMAGVDASDIPQVEAIQASSAQMTALVTPIIQGERAGSDSPIPAPLRQCTDAQLSLITTDIQAQYHEIMSVGENAESLDDIFVFGELQIEFREKVWAQVPACADAYDIAWLMYRITGDTALIMALKFAGAANDEIPYLTLAVNDMDRLSKMLAEIGSN